MILAGFDSVPRVARLVRERLAGGARFAWLFGDRMGDSIALRYALDADGQIEHYCGVVDGPVASLTDIVPGALWHEREAHERFGIAFTGVELAPMLVPQDPAGLRRNHAPEVSTVLYGPIRSGIGESACWVIETAGEDFLNVVPSMFYKRRELERACLEANLESLPLIAEQVSGATAVSHAVGLSRACEHALGIQIPQAAAAVRCALLECERIHQHLDALAKLADDGSLSVGSAQVFIAKERMHRFLAEATGSRFSRGTIGVGGLRTDVYPQLRATCEDSLEGMERETVQTLDTYFATQSLLDRLVGTGRLDESVLRAQAIVGPVARAGAIRCDARRHDPWFPLGQAEEVLESSSDALARAFVRRREILASFGLIRMALDVGTGGAYRAPAAIQNGVGLSHVESPQGELLYFVRFDEGVAHVAVRSASFQNWAAFVPSLPNNIFTDFSFIEHSFGLIQSEVDR